MEVTPASHQIYAAVEKLLIPAKLPGPWEPCLTSPGYWETAPDPERYLDLLQSQFTLADLAAAGVLSLAQHDAQPILHPDLKVPGRKWLALRATPNGLPFDFLTDSGSLSGRLPLMASQEDYQVRQLLAQEQCDLLVAATVEDAAALLGAGLPATISAGLAQLRREPLQKFLLAFDLVRPKKNPASSPSQAAAGQPGVAAAGGQPGAAAAVGQPDAPVAVDQPGVAADVGQPDAAVAVVQPAAPQLIFVAWSPAGLSLQAPGQDAVRLFCENLYHKLAIHHDFGWWQPTDEGLARLAFAVQTLDKAGLGERLLEDLESSSRSVIRHQPKAAPSKPVTPRAAVEPGKRSVFNPLASEQHAEQWRKLVDEKVLGPLFQQAEACSCPLVKNLRIVHFATSVVLHNFAQKVVAAYSPAKKLDFEDMDHASLPRLQMLVDITVKLMKEIQAAEAGDKPCRSCSQSKVPKEQTRSKSAGS